MSALQRITATVARSISRAHARSNPPALSPARATVSARSSHRSTSHSAERQLPSCHAHAHSQLWYPRVSYGLPELQRIQATAVAQLRTTNSSSLHTRTRMLSARSSTQSYSTSATFIASLLSRVYARGLLESSPANLLRFRRTHELERITAPTVASLLSRTHAHSQVRTPTIPQILESH